MGSLAVDTRTSAGLSPAALWPRDTTSLVPSPSADESRGQKCPKTGTKNITIRIPDLFSSIMSAPVPIHQDYRKVKERSVPYIARVLKLDAKKAKKNARTDFTYLSAVWIPGTSEASLWLMSIWNEWIFWFDDQFDEGHLKEDPLAAAEEVERTLAIFDGKPTPPDGDRPLEGLLRTVLSEFRKTASPSHQFRLKFFHQKYLAGLIEQVNFTSRGGRLDFDVESYMAYRRSTIGTEAAWIFMEWSYNLNLPQYVLQHPSLVTCTVAATDITILDNDILSMQKDIQFDVQHNAVTLLRARGLGMQAAVDEVGRILEDCYAQWEDAVAKLPSWGKEIDDQVAILLQGYLAMPLGTLDWYFQSGRYFPEQVEKVRKTQMLDLVVPEGCLL